VTFFYGMLHIWASKSGYKNCYNFMFWVW
jgi:hypothetical protein